MCARSCVLVGMCRQGCALIVARCACARVNACSSTAGLDLTTSSGDHRARTPTTRPRLWCATLHAGAGQEAERAARAAEPAQPGLPRARLRFSRRRLSRNSSTALPATSSGGISFTTESSQRKHPSLPAAGQHFALHLSQLPRRPVLAT